MKQEEIYDRFTAVVDQFFRQGPPRYVDEAKLFFIGGVLQSALFLLPNERYFELKNYIYTTYGYDPGGCAERQVVIQDLMGGTNEN